MDDEVVMCSTNIQVCDMVISSLYIILFIQMETDMERIHFHSNAHAPC